MLLLARPGRRAGKSQNGGLHDDLELGGIRRDGNILSRLAVGPSLAVQTLDVDQVQARFRCRCQWLLWLKARCTAAGQSGIFFPSSTLSARQGVAVIGVAVANERTTWKFGLRGTRDVRIEVEHAAQKRVTRRAVGRNLDPRSGGLRRRQRLSVSRCDREQRVCLLRVTRTGKRRYKKPRDANPPVGPCGDFGRVVPIPAPIVLNVVEPWP